MSEQRPERPQRKNKSGGGLNPGGMRFSRGLFGWAVCIGLAAMVFMFFNSKSNAYLPIPLNLFESQLSQSSTKTPIIKSIEIDGDDIQGQYMTKMKIQLADKQDHLTDYFQTTVPSGTFQNTGYLIRLLDRAGSETEVKAYNNGNLLINVLLPVVPWLLLFVVIYVVLFRQIRGGGGAGGMLGNFGRSKHRITSKEHTNVTFEDVAGIEEAKEEVMEIVEFLKNPRKFQRLGGRIPRGVLLVGDPGTGKTLLAKAIAGEADCPFFSISGSDFVEMFVGVGASRVRDLFKQAKDNSPCIIFLDEIDAVGRRRGSGFSSGGHDEREQTLNAILVEMDGFDTNDQVIVCAATNRVDVLDPALTRPGRFDRQIAVPLPDIKGRLEILKVHSRKVKLGPNVDLTRLAKATPGFSGADLAAIINESALGATLANKDYIELDDLEEARDKVRWGRARKSRVIDEKEKLATAYHEAGHAVVQFLEEDADPIHKVTIIPRGQMGGSTMSLPDKDRMSTSRKWCLSFLRIGIAGRIAEEMFTGDVNTGAYGDIRQVTNVARKMVRDWGMNDQVGFIYYGEDDSRPSYMAGISESREFSEETARLIDSEVKKLIDQKEKETREICVANKDKIETMAKALMKYETLDSSDVDRIMRGDVLTKPTVADLLEREQGRRPPMAQPKPDQGPDMRLGGGPLPAPG